MKHIPESIIDFVAGVIPVSVFEQQLYRDAAIETVLSAEKAPAYCHTGTTLFHYLIGLNYQRPGDVLNARHVLEELLARYQIPVNVCHHATKEFELMQAAQPAWLCADMSYVASLLAEAPELSDKARKIWLRQQILAKFRYVKRPPKWLQDHIWPMSDAGPLVFLGQLKVDGYGHDNAVVYVFHDPQTNTCQSVMQTA